MSCALHSKNLAGQPLFLTQVSTQQWLNPKNVVGMRKTGMNHADQGFRVIPTHNLNVR